MHCGGLPDNFAWLTIKAYALLVNQDVWEEEKVYICNHCKPKVKIDIIPPRAVVNDLETVPLPDELDPFSLQLIQLAKTFQTVIRLKTYSKRVPTYNACKGNMFILPLPMANTAETLALNECGLPKPQLFVKVDGVPTKNKVLWRKLVDINKIERALTKLKQINWLYI